MTFVSYAFLAFLPIILVLGTVLRGRPRTWMLLAASYVFYGWWDWRFLGLIAASTLIDFACGQALDHERHPARGDRSRRLIVSTSIAANLGLLGFFKYFGFFVESARTALGSFPIPFGLDTLEIVLPVGISFYTFQTMSYTIDVYRGEMRSTRRLDDFALFVAFFPQLVAGPIERARHLLPQVEQPRRATPDEFTSGLELVLVGFLFKMVVADNMAPFVNTVFHEHAPAGSAVAVAALAFAFQIYGDFAGYSLIARGTARMLGFDITPNFLVPYISRTPSEFWQRWHISLSSWLRDYLYIPLGGNRGGRAATYRNLVLTMLLGGLWHGASWTFVAWGAFHGALLVAYRLAGDRSAGARARAASLRGVLSAGMFFAVTCFGWLIFRADDFGQLTTFTRALVANFDPGAVAWGPTVRLGLYLVPMLAIDAARLARHDMEPWTQLPVGARVVMAVAILYAIVLLGTPYSAEFIYFQF